MTENEKIMEIILQMQQQLSGIDQHMAGMEQHITGIDQRMTGMEQKIAGLEQRMENIEHTTTGIQRDVIKVRTTQENTVVPHIKLLAEGYGSLQEKLDNLAEVSPIPDMKDDIDIMQKAITSIAKAK